ncbi:MAG TPA: zinc-binding dehydrogenase [Solirubrobacteraceae bacterium]|jgi:NADPH:quinone reductase-like Zn-dependent oxidoreductase|nr:zinc-binding dehydrogenase [Solirubrobacteraceae bacterium]
MRAIVMSEHGGPEVLKMGELPAPVPGEGEVLIRVRAFGLNHADTYMRSGVWSFGVPVLGIEAAGTVEHDPSGALAPGTKVVAIVGGMARTRTGSYAELVSVPVTNVVAVETDLGWAELAAIPEVYATAWIALYDNLRLRGGETVLVRGATSAVGQAAVNLAVDGGARVIATTRSGARESLLRELGAETVLIDDGELAAQVHKTYDGGVDAVLDLVGNRVLRDSLRCVRPKGRVCQIGFLAGLEPLADFNPLADLPSGVQLSTFASAFVLGEERFPIADVPLQEIVEKAGRGVFAAKPARVFGFEQIVEAHRLMDSGEAGGKLVAEVAGYTDYPTAHEGG